MRTGGTRTSLFALTCLLLTACGGGSGNVRPPAAPSASPATPPAHASCVVIAGEWKAAWAMPPCGEHAAGASLVTISQEGCTVTFVIPGLGNFSGTLSGDQSVPNLLLVFGDEAPGNGPSCTRRSEGGLRMEGEHRIWIPFGSSFPPCCQHGSVTLTR